MNFAKVKSAQVNLLTPREVEIEVDLSKGLHQFSIVGLPDKAVEESKDRVSSAIKNSGFKSPKQKNQKIIVSLAPADMKKEGPSFDLPIALTYLLACGDIEFDPKEKLFVGELSLDGRVRPVHGILPITRFAKKAGFKEIYIPEENLYEAGFVEGINIFPVTTLIELIRHLNEQIEEGEEKILITKAEKSKPKGETQEIDVDMGHIKSQSLAKRALEIAAAGKHNIALFGPPGTGKTMLARAFRHILPPLSKEEMLDVSGIHSVAGTLHNNIVEIPPYRSPHHTSSYVALVGGGNIPKPGEVTLAHKGILFLDEFPEFDRRVIDALREPLEDKVVSISRARGSAQFPADFILIVAYNPCPCGNFGSPDKKCECLGFALERYRKKISGPIVDRIDIWVEVGRIKHDDLLNSDYKKETNIIKERIIRARENQKKRFKEMNENITTNNEISAKNIKKLSLLNEDAKIILNQSAARLGLSARSYHRVIKVARTIADLENSLEIKKEHMLEALQYRPKITG